MKRACARPRCPRFATAGSGYCAAHVRSTTGSGYGGVHQAARRQLERRLPAPCAYGCGRILSRRDRWVAAHVEDGNPRAGWVPACIDCNAQAQRGGMRPSLAHAVGAR